MRTVAASLALVVVVSCAGPAGGATFAWAFTQAGTYPYYCRLHAGMHATLIVR